MHKPDLVPCGVAVLVCKDVDKLPNGTLVPREILVGKRKGSHGAGSWSIPGGKVEPRECLLATARREVEEETGLVVSAVPFTLFPFNNVIAGGQPWVTIYFISQVMRDARAAVMEPDKCEEWRWCYINDLPSPLFEPLEELVANIRRVR